MLAELTAIGFTEYEAKVYLALLRENPATGYQLGKAAGIPRSMVYEALGRLHARGAVLRTEEGRTTLYRPVPPDTLVERYEREQRDLLQSLRAGLVAIYNAREEDRFWTAGGRPSVLAHARQLLQDARHELFLVIDDPELDVLRADILAAAARGVAVHALLTGAGELPGKQVAHHPRGESELQQLGGSLILVADGTRVLIAGNAPELSATVTNNRHLAFVTRQFVWMELFTQRLYARLGPQLLARLSPADRRALRDLQPG